MSSIWLLLLLSLTSTTTIQAAQPAKGPLLWSDEFDSSSTKISVNGTKWGIDVGGGGWGNVEFQYYTDSLDNVYLQNGKLHLTALSTTDGQSPPTFTSGRIKTDDRVYFRYGIIEARVKVPNVDGGLWFGFWTLGQTYPEIPWPYSGELDITEIGAGAAVPTGTVNQRIIGGVHYNYKGMNINNVSAVEVGSPLYQDFHTYALEWTPEYARMYIDWGQVHYQPFDDTCLNCTALHDPHFLLLNLAVGGDFTYVQGDPRGPERITAEFPATVQVDYVRVYDLADGGSEITYGPRSVPSPPTSAPTIAPTQPPPTQSPTAPPSTAAPTKPDPASCSLHPICAKNNLTGLCCPTAVGDMLDCCTPTPTPGDGGSGGGNPPSPTTNDKNNTNGGVQVLLRCMENPKCNALELEGVCCPTNDNKYLDCCQAVPDECNQPNTACEIYSAEQYKKDQEAASAAPSRTSAIWHLLLGTTGMFLLLPCFFEFAW
jgi:beta-glucanase (GH16 family)